jgi:hypothetical protein
MSPPSVELRRGPSAARIGDPKSEDEERLLTSLLIYTGLDIRETKMASSSFQCIPF